MKFFLILIILIIVSSSCSLLDIHNNENDFKKEIEFVKNIGENPGNFEFLLKSSSFYDSTIFYSHLSMDYYKYYLNESLEECKLQVFKYFYTDCQSKLTKFNICKVVCLRKNCKKWSDRHLQFYFKEVNNSVKLIEMNMVMY